MDIKPLFLGTVIYLIIMATSTVVYLQTQDFTKAIIFAVLSTFIWVLLIWTVKAVSDQRQR